MFRQSLIDGNNLVKMVTTHWKLPTDRKGYYIDGYALVCPCIFSYKRSSLFLVVFTGNVCDSDLEITLLIQIMCVEWVLNQCGPVLILISYILIRMFVQNVDKHLDILQTCRVCAKKLGKGTRKTNVKYLQNDIFVLWGQNVALDSPHVTL